MDKKQTNAEIVKKFLYEHFIKDNMDVPEISNYTLIPAACEEDRLVFVNENGDHSVEISHNAAEGFSCWDFDFCDLMLLLSNIDDKKFRLTIPAYYLPNALEIMQYKIKQLGIDVELEENKEESEKTNSRDDTVGMCLVYDLIFLTDADVATFKLYLGNYIDDAN